MAWLPIDTAPRDGTRFLLCWGYWYPGDDAPTKGVDLVEWRDGAFRHDDDEPFGSIAYGWMPVETPPDPPRGAS